MVLTVYVAINWNIWLQNVSNDMRSRDFWRNEMQCGYFNMTRVEGRKLLS